MMAGALFPIVILFLLDILKLKIETRRDIENSCRYPVIGEIPLSQYDDALRTLRTNLLLNFDEGQKTILVASHSGGDGKTFLAQHLTDSLTAISKKVTLINADFRSVSLPKGHPSDILASPDFASQIAQAKANSDYVILDTPALDKYVDAYQIAKFADTTLFVVKAESTSKSVLESLSSDTRLPNIMLALNGIDMSKKKYKFIYKN
jgi:Mrp family chromosome partitioning ATPase